MNKHKIFNDDEISAITPFINFLMNTGEHWQEFKTRTSKRNFMSISYINNIPEYDRYYIGEYDTELQFIIQRLTKIANDTIIDNSKLINIQLFVNYYKDGNSSTPQHSHGCRQLTLAFGSSRILTVGSRKVTLNNGECIFLNGEKHSVPKSDVHEPRISFNLFFTTSTEQKFNVYG